MNLYFFADNLVAHEFLHLLAALVISLLIYKKYHRQKLVIIVFFVSFFIDVDHYFEGFFFNKLFSNLHLLTSPGNFWGLTGKMTLFLHGWEYLPILFLLSLKFKKWQPFFISVFWASLGHYLVDFLTYCLLCDMSLKHYFLVYRYSVNFETKILCPSCSEAYHVLE